MDIELSLLRGIEKEKAIPFDELVAIIEQAILTAYSKHVAADGVTPEGVRVDLDRKTGHVAVLQVVKDEEGAIIGEEDATPDDFGRIAAFAASRSSASVSVTSRTTSCSATSRTRKATSSPA